MRWNYLSIPKFQRCNRWSLEWISSFIPPVTGHVITYPCRIKVNPLGSTAHGKYLMNLNRVVKLLWIFPWASLTIGLPEIFRVTLTGMHLCKSVTFPLQTHIFALSPKKVDCHIKSGVVRVATAIFMTRRAFRGWVPDRKCEYPPPLTGHPSPPGLQLTRRTVGFSTGPRTQEIRWHRGYLKALQKGNRCFTWRAENISYTCTPEFETNP